MNPLQNRHIGAFALIAPLLIFLGLFFVWPLVTILVESVSDRAVATALTDDQKGGSAMETGFST